MNINFNNKNFLSEVESFTKNNLIRKSDLQKLIELSVSSRKETELEELSFTAKYICGMIRVLKHAPGIPEAQNINQVKEDINLNLKKAIEQLREIITSDAQLKNYFEETYLSLTSENLINLNQLLSDLESVKKYINYLKRLS
ncbi:MAG: hypothetical protein ACHQLA_08945 [Ignavibacteriales bacterium]